MYRVCTNTNTYSRGNLVFFKSSGEVTHVGIYLGNNKFVHASLSKGVCVADLKTFGDYEIKSI